jgi:hypothetical protein
MIPTTVDTPMTSPASTKAALPLRRKRFLIDIALRVIVIPFRILIVIFLHQMDRSFCPKIKLPEEMPKMHFFSQAL